MDDDEVRMAELFKEIGDQTGSQESVSPRLLCFYSFFYMYRELTLFPKNAGLDTLSACPGVLNKSRLLSTFLRNRLTHVSC